MISWFHYIDWIQQINSCQLIGWLQLNGWSKPAERLEPVIVLLEPNLISNIYELLHFSCSGRSMCDVYVSMFVPLSQQPCDKSYRSYLEAAYQCVKGTHIYNPYYAYTLQTCDSMAINLLLQYVNGGTVLLL